MGGLGCLGSMINVSDNLLCMIVAQRSHIVSHAGLHTRPTNHPKPFKLTKKMLDAATSVAHQSMCRT